MPLEAGTVLGPYEILALIGEGGMGEVYKARDTRLDRIVAIKTLHGAFSERFEREARAISSLNHPNICTLHDIGSQDGISYLVMEYVEGNPIQGPMPIPDVLRYGAQICDALELAHRNRIVHRDLKPANILLTKQGIKLLDFGLARFDKPVLGPDDATLANALTSGGTILGTPQYMAPEQAEGKETDARADIFSLGCVLYEMVTGKRAFDGKSMASIIAAVMAAEPPPLSQSQPLTPPSLEWTVQRCLKKDSTERWQSARDLGRQLEWMGQEKIPPTASIVAPAPSNTSRIPAIAAGLLTVTAIVLAAIHFTEKPESKPLVRVALHLPIDFTAAPPVPSPDGTKLVFEGRNENVAGLFLRSLDSLEVTRIPGTDSATAPFWSPDGKRIGFFDSGSLKTLVLDGKLFQTICNVSRSRVNGGAWGTKGYIVFSGTVGEPVYRIAEGGGTPVPVTILAEGTTAHRYPSFLPDGIHFLYQAVDLRPNSSQILMGIAGDKPAPGKLVSPGESPALFMRSVLGGVDHLLLSRGATLMALPFHSASFSVSGDPIPIGETIPNSLAGGTIRFNSSRDGVVGYFSGKDSGRTFRLVDRAGKELSVISNSGLLSHPSLSPDGSQVATDDPNAILGSSDIWLFNIDRHTKTRFTADGTTGQAPIWSKDGSALYYASLRGGTYGFYTKAVTPGATEQKLADIGKRVSFPAAVIGSKWLLYHTSTPNTGYDIWKLPLSPPHTPQPLLQTPFNESSAQVSPNGKWLAYSSDESGVEEIYLQSFDAETATLGSQRLQVSLTGGRHPRWRRDGKELFYISPKVILTSVATDPIRGFSGSATVSLFSVQGVYFGNASFPYDVSADGQKFVINSTTGQSSLEFILLLNLPSLLRR